MRESPSTMDHHLVCLLSHTLDLGSKLFTRLANRQYYPATSINYRFAFLKMSCLTLSRPSPFRALAHGHYQDTIPRYWLMKGFHVIRRFGWDSHGVPIEYEIYEKLGMSGRDAFSKTGLEKYNAERRAIVMTYATEWRQTIVCLGRWVDFDNG